MTTTRTRLLAEDHAARLPLKIAAAARPFAYDRPDGYPDDARALRLALAYWLDRAGTTTAERALIVEVLAALDEPGYVEILAPRLWHRVQDEIREEEYRERQARLYGLP